MTPPWLSSAPGRTGGFACRHREAILAALGRKRVVQGEQGRTGGGGEGGGRRQWSNSRVEVILAASGRKRGEEGESGQRGGRGRNFVPYDV